MALSYSERERLITYLLEETSYTRLQIEKSARTDEQLVGMATRIKTCMEEYPYEILNFFKSNPGDDEYTLEELLGMKYNELSALRKELGIKNGGKKTSSTGVGKNSQTDGQLRLDLSCGTGTPRIFVEHSDHEPQVFTDEELEIMFPGESDAFTASELFAMGIIREGHSPDEDKFEQQQREDEEYIMMSTIVETGVIIGQHRLTIEDCYELNPKDLRTLYNLVQMFIPPEKGQELNKRP